MVYTDFAARIMLSLLLGFFIGLERQLTGHLAGIMFACGKVHIHLSAWKAAPEEEHQNLAALP